MDTSTTRGSVALIDGEDVLLEEHFAADRSHGSELMPVLGRALKIAERPELIAVGLGPGSYAGVRISIATAMGLALALDAKLVGLPSVAALDTEAPRYVAIGDARRDTFYFTLVQDGGCIEGPLLLNETDLRARLAVLEDPVLVTPEPLPVFPKASVALPRALVLARLAAKGVSIVAEGSLEPLYLREPVITWPKPR